MNFFFKINVGRCQSPHLSESRRRRSKCPNRSLGDGLQDTTPRTQLPHTKPQRTLSVQRPWHTKRSDIYLHCGSCSGSWHTCCRCCDTHTGFHGHLRLVPVYNMSGLTDVECLPVTVPTERSGTLWCMVIQIYGYMSTIRPNIYNQ